MARLRPQDVTNVLRRHLAMYHPAGEPYSTTDKLDIISFDIQMW